MVVEDIRTLKEAEPFRPSKLVLANGEELLLERRSGIAIAPEGRFVLYPREPAGYRVLLPSDVKSVEAVRSNAA